MPVNVFTSAARATRPVSPPRSRLAATALVELCEHARGGDQGAWRDLVNEFSGLVWAITRAHRLSDADAADVTQETFARFVENLDRLRDPQCVGAWLATTARRECLAVLRQRARVVLRGDDMSDTVNEETPGHDAALITAERDEGLWRAFERLSDRDRSLLRLLIAELPPSYEEISAALDMPIGSIGPTRARALERLRRHAQALGVLDELQDRLP